MKLRLLLTVIFGLSAFATALRQAENPQIRKEIRQHYSKWDRLVEAGDFKALFQMMDPSFMAVDKNGKATTCAQFKKQFEAIMQTVRDPKSKIVIKQVQTQGDEVVAWGSMTASFKMKQGSAWKPMSITMNFAETLKKVGGEWKFMSSQELP